MSRTKKDMPYLRQIRKEQEKQVNPYQRSSNHRLKETAKLWRVS